MQHARLQQVVVNEGVSARHIRIHLHERSDVHKSYAIVHLQVSA